MKRIDSGRSASSATFDFAHLPELADGNLPPSPSSRFTEADFIALFESSGEALIVIDRIGVIQNANLRGRELLRLKETDQRHIGLEDLVPGANLEPLEKFYDQRTPAQVFPALDTTLANGNPIRITLRSVLQVPGRVVLCLEEAPVFPAGEGGFGSDSGEGAPDGKNGGAGQIRIRSRA